MNRTDIEWTDWSVNPIKLKLPSGKTVNACTKVSAGCANCYAESITKRFWPKAEGDFPGYRLPLLDRGELVLLDHELKAVLRLDRRIADGKADPDENKVFWGDMNDLFGEWVPFDMLDRCFAVMALTPHLVHQVLTKRPERMAEYFNTSRRWAYDAACTMDVSRKAAIAGEAGYIVEDGDNAAGAIISGPWPLPNVWIGTSVEDQKAADARIPHLLRCPAKVRFLSCEPLLGAVELGYGYEMDASGDSDVGCVPCDVGGKRHQHPLHERCYRGVDWVIAGGESGPHARPMHTDWARSLRNQCQAARVPYFFKQWGAFRPQENEAASIAIDQAGQTIYGMTPDGFVGMSRIGKKRAGRLLDGRTWDEMPDSLRVRQMPGVGSEAGLARGGSS